MCLILALEAQQNCKNKKNFYTTRGTKGSEGSDYNIRNARYILFVHNLFRIIKDSTKVKTQP